MLNDRNSNQRTEKEKEMGDERRRRCRTRGREWDEDSAASARNRITNFKNFLLIGMYCLIVGDDDDHRHEARST
jgi:hypothetical protein